jgi:hypothetical protein
MAWKAGQLRKLDVSWNELGKSESRESVQDPSTGRNRSSEQRWHEAEIHWSKYRR